MNKAHRMVWRALRVMDAIVAGSAAVVVVGITASL